jgi:flavin-dependent dehydrogenase
MAAIEAGAEFREQFTVDEYISENGRVVDVIGKDVRSQSRTSERSLLTIGADGRNSRLARTVGAPTYDAVPPLTC